MNPGPELDTLIAEKLMGWEWVEKPPGGDGYFMGRYLENPGFSDRFPSLAVKVSKSIPIATWWKPTGNLPAYSTSVAAAWEVVEKMGGRDFCLEMQRGKWQATFDYKDVAVSGQWSQHPALAICLAALEAVEVEGK